MRDRASECPDKSGNLRAVPERDSGHTDNPYSTLEVKNLTSIQLCEIRAVIIEEMQARADALP